jgi:hypothetical protein
MPQTSTTSQEPGSARSVSLNSLPNAPPPPNLGPLGSMGNGSGSPAAKPKTLDQGAPEFPETMGLAACLLRRLDAGLPYSFAGEEVLVALGGVKRGVSRGVNGGEMMGNQGNQ